MSALLGIKTTLYSKMKSVVIHIFHRDLRVEDNLGLQKALQKNLPLLPLFILTPDQFTEQNKYRSENSIQFMLESLKDLDKQLDNKLTVIAATQMEALLSLKNQYNIKAISENRDYTPYAKKRETETLLFCTQFDIEYLITDDAYLTSPGSIVNKSGKPYQKFTPFYNAAKEKPVPHPVKTPKFKNLIKAPQSIEIPNSQKNPEIHQHGGTSEALKLLEILPKDYDSTKDHPSIPTSNLSAHNHFGTVSIRTVYYALNNIEFRRQLYWREFYGQIVYSFESLYGEDPYTFQNTPPKTWSTDVKEFQKWTDGKTGHALVDAAMMQLKKSGYIHNRARLMAAVYLTKHLKIYWRWGERHFAKHLVDYDFAQNFGNWCWVASVLPFSQAPFRSMDPEVQLKKYDRDHIYVNTWLKR